MTIRASNLFFISSSFLQRRDSSAPVLPNASTLTMSPTKHIGLELILYQYKSFRASGFFFLCI